MRRRDKKSWLTGGEVGLADMAIGLLGPSVFLLLVFLSASSSGSRNDCRGLDEAEIAEKAHLLTDWAARERALTASLREAAKKNCASTPRGPSVNSEAPGAQFVPGFLIDVCPVNRTEVQERANLTPEGIESLAAERNAVNNELLGCISAKNDNREVCVRPVDAKRTALLRRLKEWRTQIEQDIQEREKLVEERCPTASSSGANSAEASLSVAPLEGQSLCSGDKASLLVEAGLSDFALSRLRDRGARATAKLKGCLSLEATTEVIDRSINFVTCTGDFAKQDSEERLDAEAANAKFDHIAQIVLERLSKERFRFNRLDILGHSDERPVKKDKECAGARNNAELASLRAHRVSQNILAAIARLAAQNDRSALEAQERLSNGRLRLYAIGVGEAEPICRYAKHEMEHRQNRRIEFRFAYQELRLPKCGGR